MVRIINVDKKGLTIHHSSLTGGKKVRLDMSKEDVIELAGLFNKLINSDRINIMDEKQFNSKLYIEIIDKHNDCNFPQRFSYRVNVDTTVKKELAEFILENCKNATLLKRRSEHSDYNIEAETVNYKLKICIPYKNFNQKLLGSGYIEINKVVSKESILEVIAKYTREINNKYDQYSVFVFVKKSERCRKYKLVEFNMDLDTIDRDIIDTLRTKFHLRDERYIYRDNSVIISTLKAGFEDIQDFRRCYGSLINNTVNCNGMNKDEIVSSIETNIQKCLYTKKQLKEMGIK